MGVLSLTVGIYVRMAEASGDLFISKISTKLGSVHIDSITGILMGELTFSQGVYASHFRSMQTREASSGVVECNAFPAPSNRRRSNSYSSHTTTR